MRPVDGPMPAHLGHLLLFPHTRVLPSVLLSRVSPPRNWFLLKSNPVSSPVLPRSSLFHEVVFRLPLLLIAENEVASIHLRSSPPILEMDHNSKSNHQHHLGINKLGKNIRKSPLHQSSYQKLPPAAAANQQPPPPQPHVYNISKSDFRSVVQQLTGSPSRDAARYPAVPARPPQPKHPSSRLMKIRPPPLTPIARPPPLPFQNQPPNPNPNPNPSHNFNINQTFFPRPVPSPHTNGNVAWADSPVSAYMRYLESSLQTSDSARQPPFPHAQSSNSGPSPFPPGNRTTGLPPAQTALLPSPKSQFLLLSPGSHFPFPSPGASLPLPSPNSQFPLNSPSSFLNLLTPKSPYALLSPRFQYSTSLPPNFSFSPLPQNGLLGPGPGSLPPPSPTLLFPPSPSGFLPLLSPRWREM